MKAVSATPVGAMSYWLEPKGGETMKEKIIDTRIVNGELTNITTSDGDNFLQESDDMDHKTELNHIRVIIASALKREGKIINKRKDETNKLQIAIGNIKPAIDIQYDHEKSPSQLIVTRSNDYKTGKIKIDWD